MFQYIQLVDINYSWSITVRTEAKFPFYQDSQCFILMDTMLRLKNNRGKIVSFTN